MNVDTVLACFDNEVQGRIGEVATEVWDVVERRQEGGLRRLRNFLDQVRAAGSHWFMSCARIG